MTTTLRSPPPIPGGRPSVSLTVLLLAGLLAAVDAPCALAQTAPAVVAGSRVRITAPDAGLRRAVGTVQEITEDAFIVQFRNPRGVGTVQRASIASMDVSIRRERRVLKTLGKGLLIGLGSGAVMGLASGDDPPGFLSFSAEEKAAMLGILGGLTGGVIGLIAGAATQHDVWSGVHVQGVDVAIVPIFAQRGAGLHIGMTFPAG